MAHNVNVTKMKRQQYKRRRGTYKPLSEEGMNGGKTFVSEKLKPFWSENVHIRVRGGGQSRVNKDKVPESQRGYMAYRDHVKAEDKFGNDRYETTHTLGVHSVQLTPQRRSLVEAIFAKPKSEEVKAIEQIIPEIPFDEYFACVVVERTRFSITRLFYNGSKTCCFFVEQTKTVLRGSITYGSAERAKAVLRQQTICWKGLHDI